MSDEFNHKTAAAYADIIACCRTLREFRERHRGEYQKLRKDRATFDRLTANLERRAYPAVRARKRDWTEDAVRTEAKRFSDKRGFRVGCRSGYEAALRFGIIGELFPRATRWNLENSVAEAVRCGVWSKFRGNTLRGDALIEDIRNKKPNGEEFLEKRGDVIQRRSSGGAHNWLKVNDPLAYAVTKACIRSGSPWTAEQILAQIVAEREQPGSRLPQLLEAEAAGGSRRHWIAREGDRIHQEYLREHKPWAVRQSVTERKAQWRKEKVQMHQESKKRREADQGTWRDPEAQ